MSLLYRAIWKDWRPDLVSEVEAHMRCWLAEKHRLVSGDDHAASEGVEFRVVRAQADGYRAVEVSISEESDGQQISPVVRAIEVANREFGWVWVDVSRVSASYFDWRPMHAPKFVRSLIESGQHLDRPPRSGEIPLSTDVETIRSEGVEALAKLVRHADRNLPVVVASTRSEDSGHDARASATARSLAGIARVYSLDEEATSPFRDVMGTDLAVWGGAMRVYLPGGGPPSRHRYVPWTRIHRGLHLAGDQIHALLGPFVTARPAPSDFAPVRTQLSASSHPDEDLVELAEQEIDELKRQLAELNDEMVLLAVENEELATDLGIAHQNLRLINRPEVAEASETAITEIDIRSITSVRQAVELACHHLRDWLVIPDEAIARVDECDTSVSSGAWGTTTWRGLLALHDYAKAGQGGGFWQWCQRGDSTWPATDKKLAMKESETVIQSPRLQASRRLPIQEATGVGPTVLMEAHLKVAEGGGVLAPRVYFYDDTGGPTGKVHVGFVGPHKYMPNKSTN